MTINQLDHQIPDTNQTAWQLASVQLSGWTSLPILMTSLAVLHKNSLLGALFTIIIGNGIVWFLRLAIIAMSFKNKQSTLDLSVEYLGNPGKYTVAVLLLLSTLFWFITQTSVSADSLTHLIKVNENKNIDQFIQISVLIGCLSTLFCAGGILSLRKLAEYSLPILLMTFIIIFSFIPLNNFSLDNQEITLSGLSLILSTNLGTTTDLPTFFRHSKSWNESIKALTIIQLVTLLLGIAAVFMGSIIDFSNSLDSIAFDNSSGLLLRISLIAFLFISATCANVANVYSASVGWEIVAPKNLVGGKEYFILGLSLTTIFILLKKFAISEQLLQITDCSLVNLCATLVIAFIIKSRYKQSISLFNQYTYFSAWIIACCVNVFMINFLNTSGISATITSLLVIIFIIFFSKGFQYILSQNNKK